MQKTYYNKLVRDNIPALIIARGKNCECRILKDNEEFKNQLLNKLVEELNELLEALHTDNKKNIIEELVDLKEILETIRELNGISLEEFLDASIKKREEKGSFKNRIFLQLVTEGEETK